MNLKWHNVKFEVRNDMFLEVDPRRDVQRLRVKDKWTSGSMWSFEILEIIGSMRQLYFGSFEGLWHHKGGKKT